MLSSVLRIHEGLAATRRLSIATPQTKPGVWELGALLTIGVSAGLALSYAKLNLGIPGHVILLNFAPLAFGLGLVPRRGAGTAMGLTAAATMAIAAHTGAGAMVSMLMTGILLDLALAKAKGGLPLYAAFVVAGLGGNAAAFVARAIAKLGGVEPGAVPFSMWWSHALVSYALCGALTGLASALLWFSVRKRSA